MLCTSWTFPELRLCWIYITRSSVWKLLMFFCKGNTLVWCPANRAYYCRFSECCTFVDYDQPPAKVLTQSAEPDTLACNQILLEERDEKNWWKKKSFLYYRDDKTACSLDYFSPYFLNVISQCLKHQNTFQSPSFYRAGDQYLILKYPVPVV